MSAKCQKHSRAGFTLVELMVALMSAAVLCLTMGAMLWYLSTGMARMRGSMEMQRDLRASLDVVSRLVRVGTNMTFVATSGVFNVQSASRAPARVYRSGSRLWFDTDTTRGGADVVLVSAGLTNFSITLGTNRDAIVSLAIAAGTDRVSNRVVVARRN